MINGQKENESLHTKTDEINIAQNENYFQDRNAMQRWKIELTFFEYNRMKEWRGRVETNKNVSKF